MTRGRRQAAALPVSRMSHMPQPGGSNSQEEHGQQPSQEERHAHAQQQRQSLLARLRESLLQESSDRYAIAHQSAPNALDDTATAAIPGTQQTALSGSRPRTCSEDNVSSLGSSDQQVARSSFGSSLPVGSFINRPGRTSDQSGALSLQDRLWLLQQQQQQQQQQPQQSPQQQQHQLDLPLPIIEGRELGELLGQAQPHAGEQFTGSFPLAASQLGAPARMPSSVEAASGSSGKRMAQPTKPPAASAPQSSSSSSAPIDPATGKQICTFYLRTGTCAYRDRCKFIHPLHCPPPRLNSRGYPLRSEEIDCVHYMKKGWCAFGVTCKFNHPEGVGISALTAPTADPLGSLPYMAVSPLPVSMPASVPGPVLSVAQPSLVFPQQAPAQAPQQLQSVLLQQQQQQQQEAMLGLQPQQQQPAQPPQAPQMYWALSPEPEDASYPQLLQQPSTYMAAMQLPMGYQVPAAAPQSQLIYAPAGVPAGMMVSAPMQYPATAAGPFSAAVQPAPQQGGYARAFGGQGLLGSGASIEQAMAQLRLPPS